MHLRKKSGRALSFVGNNASMPTRMQEATANKVKGRVLWHADGPTAEINSMSVSIDWLMTDGNYMHWRSGDKHNGTSNAGITNELSQLIKDKGITVNRPGKDIHVRINHLEEQFGAAKLVQA